MIEEPWLIRSVLQRLSGSENRVEAAEMPVLRRVVFERGSRPDLLAIRSGTWIVISSRGKEALRHGTGGGFGLSGQHIGSPGRLKALYGQSVRWWPSKKDIEPPRGK